MSKRLNLVIPDGLHEQLQRLVEAEPKAVKMRENVTLAAVAREALLRGIESLEREAKRERKAS